MSKRSIRKTRHYKTHSTFKESVHAGMKGTSKNKHDPFVQDPEAEKESSQEMDSLNENPEVHVHGEHCNHGGKE